jgi:hypothetical protein
MTKTMIVKVVAALTKQQILLLGHWLFLLVEMIRKERSRLHHQTITSSITIVHLVHFLQLQLVKTTTAFR